MEGLTKNQFKELKRKVLVQLGFINRELKRKQPLDILLRRSGITMEDIESIGYGYNEETNQIGKFREVDIQEIEEPKEPVDNRPQKPTIDLKPTELDSLHEIIQNSSEILEMLNYFKKNRADHIGQNSIIIELPFENEEDRQFKKTFRLNRVIYREFEEFLNKHKEYTAKDIVSMALKEYMENHR